jgi:hypothetical protein
MSKDPKTGVYNPISNSDIILLTDWSHQILLLQNTYSGYATEFNNRDFKSNFTNTP